MGSGHSGFAGGGEGARGGDWKEHRRALQLSLPLLHVHSRVRTDAAPCRPEGQQRPEGPGRPVGPGRLAGPYWVRPSGVRALWLCWWGRRH